jgi:hypothetical protein
MSQASQDDTQQQVHDTDPEPRGNTVEMNPAMLGQAVNMNPSSDAVKQLDDAAQLLEQATQEDDASDLTIEEYMAALITRSHTSERGMGEMEAAPPVDTASQPVEPAPPETKPGLLGPDDAETTRRRRQGAVEYRDAISELRELANISARSSFNVHQGRQLVYEMHNKLAVTLVALIVSFALTGLASQTYSLSFFAAIAALIVALSWTLKYFQLARHLHRLCFSGEEPCD